MESFPHKYNLTDEQRQFYDDNGYLVIRNLIDEDTLSVVKKRFIDVCNNAVPTGRLIAVRDMALYEKNKRPEEYINKMNFLTLDPVFSRYTEHPRLVHVVSQLLNDSNLAVHNCMMINKPPGTKWHPPHQDMFYVPLRPFSKLLSTWTAVDPVTSDNGCIFVYPGSHKKMELYQHTRVNLVNRYFYAIPETNEVVREGNTVSIGPMEPGDTIFFHSLLVHGSYSNQTNSYRKAISNLYASDDCYYIDARGTVHETVEQEVNEDLKRKFGSGLSRITLGEFTEYRTKRGNMVKSNI